MNKLSIKIIGALIVVVFFFVLALNILPNNSNLSDDSVIPSDSTDANTAINKGNGAKIISLNIENDKLKIVFDNEVSEYCIKTTKTKPTINNICFKKIQSNTVYTSIYKYKKYYIWTKDYNGNISNYISTESKNISK